MIINGTNIRMTRGDTESITVTVKERGLLDGDVVEFTVRRTPKDKVKIYKRVDAFDDGKAIIRLYAEDTENMEFGKYYYDVQLTLADGTVATIIKPSVFALTEEITYGEQT